MGLFYRKSLNFGPFRVNLSTSGIGYSLGGRGFRVGRTSRARSYTAFSLPGTGQGYRDSRSHRRPSTNHQKLGIMSYQIDPSEPSELFLRARNAAGRALQTQFSRHGGNLPKQRDFRWIKVELTWPSFDHLTFAYGNQVFSVLVELLEGARAPLTRKEIDGCLNASSENNLVPCAFPVDATTLKPISPGWNLVHLADRRTIDPVALASDEQVEMSPWEVQNFCIQVVRSHIEEKMSSTVLSFCDVTGIEPHVWFEDRFGNRNWVIVRHYPVVRGNEKDEWIGFEQSSPPLKNHDGYLAALSLTSSEAFIQDRDGNAIPLSERFSGKAPLYRGDGFYVKFDGLQRIFVS